MVAAAGMWGREFGALAGVGVPLQALAHYYVVTEAIPGLPPGLPTIKTAPDYAYVKNGAPGSWSASSSRAAIRGLPAAFPPTRSSPGCPRTGTTSGRSTSR